MKRTTATPEHWSRSRLSPFGTPAPTRRERAEDRRRGTCLHEAGHAVLAAALGYRDVFVDLDGDEHNPNPNVKFTAPRQWNPGDRRALELTVRFGGLYAQILSGHEYRDGLGSDGESADRLLRSWPEAQRAAVCDAARTLARETLETRLADVEWLAEVLEFSPLAWVEYDRGLLIASTACVKRMPCEVAL